MALFVTVLAHIVVIEQGVNAVLTKLRSTYVSFLLEGILLTFFYPWIWDQGMVDSCYSWELYCVVFECP